jgi:hypothetical protein
MYDVEADRRQTIRPDVADLGGVVPDDLAQLSFALTQYPDSIDWQADRASIQIGATEAATPEFSVTDRISTTGTASVRTGEIKGNRRDDVLAALDGGKGFRAPLLAIALVATFGLGWFGGSHSHRLGHFAAALNPLAPTPAALPHMPEKKIATAIENPVVGTPRKSAPDTAGLRKLFVSAAATTDYKPSPPRRAAPMPAPSPVSLVSPENAIAPGDEKAFARLTPSPETKPATIEGWTVRRIDGGTTAVIDGPGGSWTARQGDSVPGVGRIDSIVLWGGHWIVATSAGLIATP